MLNKVVIVMLFLAPFPVSRDKAATENDLMGTWIFEQDGTELYQITFKVDNSGLVNMGNDPAIPFAWKWKKDGPWLELQQSIDFGFNWYHLRKKGKILYGTSTWHHGEKDDGSKKTKIRLLRVRK